MGQIIRPLVEKKAEALRSLIAGLPWPKGYCPICGSLPELSFLKEMEGQRWLRCSFCSHHWSLTRLSCPLCENDDPQNLSYYFITGREQERAEVCEQCGRYLVCIDLREHPDEALLEVGAIGMVHLDLLAQEKGLLPVAACAWNIVRGEDISSIPFAFGARELNS
jgi:FdhE protein